MQLDEDQQFTEGIKIVIFTLSAGVVLFAGTSLFLAAMFVL